MMRRLILIMAWLLAGHVVAGGLYYGLLNVPESSAWMLGASALLTAALVVVTLWVEVGAMAAWLAESAPAAALLGAVRRLGWTVPALALFAATWWLSARIDAWHVAQRGSIDASLMVRLNWAETGWLHRTIDWFVFGLRYALGASLALACLATGLSAGAKGVVRPAWVVRAIDPRAWIPIVVIELALIVLPWRYRYWRPASLPPTGAEIAFVSAKLTLIALLIACGWALILRVHGRRRAS